MIEGDCLPATGDEVIFRRNDLTVCGRIAWTHGRNAGVSFAESLKPEEVLRNVPSKAPKISTKFYRPGFSARDLTPQEKRLVESWL